jgi:25S rRNA (uracil2634-N3)-methyltransferase
MPRNNKKLKGAPASARPRGPGKSSGQSNTPKGQNGNAQGQGQTKENTVKKGPVQANQRPVVPFLRKDRVLLVGEGEFGINLLLFSTSLLRLYI